MGMSATQARFLSLTARKNNVEFEGQQINQQRTTLSNESASYYSELCNMEVPTPPSIDDYTKVAYTFNDGAMTNTIISLLPRTGDDGAPTGKYSINYIEEWQDDYAIVAAASSLVEKRDDGYYIGSTKLREMGQEFAYTKRNNKFYDAAGNEVQEDDVKNAFDTYFGDDEYANTLSVDQKFSLIETEKYYLAMLREKYGNDNEDFEIRYIKNTTTGNYEPYFYSNNELTNDAKYNNKNLAAIPCSSLGSTTRTKEVLNQTGTVEKDSSGRYVAITLELENGSTRTYNLTTTTSTDEEAYNDAMNQYQYKQHEYDHKVQEINSKLEVVQQQDKQLELKLKQLDTEENAISTEMEAVKKVISKNVESSFKTFSA